MKDSLKGFKPIPYARSKPFTAYCDCCKLVRSSEILYSNDKPNKFTCSKCLHVYFLIPDKLLVEAEVARDKLFY